MFSSSIKDDDEMFLDRRARTENKNRTINFVEKYSLNEIL
jgi:hypothetical protein